MAQRVTVQNVRRAVNVVVNVVEDMGEYDVKVRRTNREQRESARRVKRLARGARVEWQ